MFNYGVARRYYMTICFGTVNLKSNFDSEVKVQTFGFDLSFMVFTSILGDQHDHDPGHIDKATRNYYIQRWIVLDCRTIHVNIM